MHHKQGHIRISSDPPPAGGLLRSDTAGMTRQYGHAVEIVPGSPGALIPGRSRRTHQRSRGQAITLRFHWKRPGRAHYRLIGIGLACCRGSGLGARRTVMAA